MHFPHHRRPRGDVDEGVLLEKNRAHTTAIRVQPHEISTAKIVGQGKISRRQRTWWNKVPTQRVHDHWSSVVKAGGSPVRNHWGDAQGRGCKVAEGQAKGPRDAESSANWTDWVVVVDDDGPADAGVGAKRFPGWRNTGGKLKDCLDFCCGNKKRKEHRLHRQKWRLLISASNFHTEIKYQK